MNNAKYQLQCKHNLYRRLSLMLVAFSRVIRYFIVLMDTGAHPRSAGTTAADL
ncbi:MAG TPA: hypothetical protein VK470_16505 [Bacteroidota bacterium]|nr:hypothetical protein [Bacteroidota bacterium]